MTVAGRDRMKKRREEMGITQVHIARKLGYKTSATISLMESGIQNIYVGQAITIAKILHTTVEELFFEEEVRN
ncbi:MULTISPECIES: helix-turn-helix transcriptional regulator [Exiguobacterium]|uniref:helix-turn-helix transcriptional regulator n=1 Tax=Exiguobacterium TaxID=33986 RepID=UPI001AE61051|nr:MULTISPECIES: helix-turn-helix transcriptional regulator [Exiguobacterium]MCT4779865.1 helix-turn-helix domain-containing protein [Exiguobacterium soli]